MPKALHDKLVREALKKGLKGERRDAYVYGTLEKVKKREQKKKSRKASR